MYCVHCGVKLADTEKKCPLCNTEVCHHCLDRTDVQPLYPPDKMPKNAPGSKVLCGAVIIIFLIPLIISFFSDMQTDGTLDWFGYVAGALVLVYIIFALPLWFKKPNPVIFVPCDFVAAALYLLYINLGTGGDWFLSFAFPVIGSSCLITCAAVTLLRYLRRGKLFILGGLFISLGAFILLIETLMDMTFGFRFIGWSVYPLIVLVILGGLLIYFAINSAAREMIERKLFF